MCALLAVAQSLKKISKLLAEESDRLAELAGHEVDVDDDASATGAAGAEAAAPARKRRKSKPRKPRDPNAPHRPANAFILFSKDHRDRVGEDGMPHKERVRLLGRMWREMPDEEKQVRIRARLHACALACRAPPPNASICPRVRARSRTTMSICATSRRSSSR